MSYGILLDAPSKPAKPIQIAQLGEYEDSRYGDFSITAADVDDWARNMSVLPGGEVLIDRDHASERKPRNSEAMGWISNVRLDGSKVLADARWTPAGKKAIKSGAYKFVSVAYGNFENEHGQTIPNVLCSVGLTNRPALTGLPAISLAAPERVASATAALQKPSKPRKPSKKKAAKQRRLERRRAKVTTLEQQVSAARTRLAQVEADRDRARSQLDTQAFDLAFREALRERRVSPGQKAPLAKMYALDSGAVIDLLESSQPILPDPAERGEPSIEFTADEIEGADFDSDAVAKQGYSPDSVQLDQQVRGRLRQTHRPIGDYQAALTEIIGEQS
jgi:hypothetical protein